MEYVESAFTYDTEIMKQCTERRSPEKEDDNGNEDNYQKHDVASAQQIFLQVPNIYGALVPSDVTLSQAEDDDVQNIYSAEKRKRSHSHHDIQTSGKSTPTRKYSLGSCNKLTSGEKTPIKQNVSSFGLNTLSLGLLSASISNINRCSSVRALRHIIKQNIVLNTKRGVRKMVINF